MVPALKNFASVGDSRGRTMRDRFWLNFYRRALWLWTFKRSRGSGVNAVRRLFYLMAPMAAASKLRWNCHTVRAIPHRWRPKDLDHGDQRISSPTAATSLTRTHLGNGLRQGLEGAK